RQAVTRCPAVATGVSARRGRGRAPAAPGVGHRRLSQLAAQERSLADTRHFAAARLGHPLANPLTRYLADARTIDEIETLPALAQIRTAWLVIADHLGSVLDGLGEAELARQQVHRFPLADSTVVGFVAFLAQHESYHVGQAAFLRRQLGKPAMAYTRGSGRSAPTAAS
ncbi:MAG TPA: DinB family protein, partial [Gemmatimonadales bacterium]|nr:DinB family protein [Gemmatimonadales bacterium]